MSKTWTKWKLTGAQCKRLSQLNNPRTHTHLHGNALTALVNKGLVTSRLSGMHGKIRWNYFITEEGETAFETARKEGW